MAVAASSTTTAMHKLPLSSVLASTLSIHPLLHILFSPVLPRLSFIESRLILSPPARVLLRLGFGVKSIVLLSVLLSFAALGKWSYQWRSILAVMGVGEAVIRTLGALHTLDVDEASSLSGTTMSEEQEKRQRQEAQEKKHLLCFWLLYAAITLSESWQPLSSSLPSLFPKSWQLPTIRLYLQKALARLTHQYPQLNRFPLPTLHSVAVAPSRVTFPQPAPLPGSPLARKQALAAISDKSREELKNSLIKLILLWVALRRDGWGASAVWDWVIGPMFTVGRKRGGGGGPGKGRRRKGVVHVVVSSREKSRSNSLDSETEKEDDDLDARNVEEGSVDHFKREIPKTSLHVKNHAHYQAQGQNYSDHRSSYPPLGQNQDIFSSTSTSSSPSASEPSYLEGDTSIEDGSQTDFSRNSSSTTSPYRSQSNTTGQGPSFPTPNHVPYRLTSSSHPIHARVVYDQPAFPTSTDSPTSHRDDKGGSGGVSPLPGYTVAGHLLDSDHVEDGETSGILSGSWDISGSGGKW